MCEDSDQCGDELICVADNSTRSTGLGRNPNSPKKVCVCDEGSGYQEDPEDNTCNGE